MSLIALPKVFIRVLDRQVQAGEGRTGEDRQVNEGRYFYAVPVPVSVPPGCRCECFLLCSKCLLYLYICAL